MTRSVPDTARPAFEFPQLTFGIPSLAGWQPKVVWLTGLMMCLGLSSASPASLTWLESKTDAMSAATNQGKLVLLVAGRMDACGLCQYMLNTVCESLSPPIKELIQDRYVPWYCDVDSHTEWQPYASGLGTFTLPLICCIDPNTTNRYLDRTTSTQTAPIFYDRLLAAATTRQPGIQVSLTQDRVSLTVTNLTVGITNRVERSFNPGDQGGWSVVSTFVSPATATNWTEVVDRDCPKAFYRVSNVVSGQ